MVAITYSLTPVDYDEIEKERRGGIARRIVRIIFGALAGFVGVYMICQVIVFPWKNHPLGSLLFLAMGLFCLWGGLEMPGLYPLLVCLSDPFAPRELRIDDKSITWRCGSRLQQSR